MQRKRKFKKSLLEADTVLAAEFSIELNGLTPDNVSCSESRTTRWWVCSKCNHNWKATINVRHNKNTRGGCPVCANRVLIPEINSLEAVRPDLAKEWHTTKNESMKPNMVFPGTDLIVWWKCKCGHEWENRVVNRVKGQGCKVCRTVGTSFPEKAIFHYIKSIFPNTQNRIKLENGLEIDIFIPYYNIVIEYDGVYWHKDKFNQDCFKTLTLSNYTFIRVREEGLETIPDCLNLFVRSQSIEDLEYAIRQIFITIKASGIEFSIPSISITRDRLDILSTIRNKELGNSLLIKFPVIASEWDYELNGGIKPENVTYASNDTYWWKCIRGHSYPMKVSQRTYNGSCCSVCSNRILLKGLNDIGTCSPLIAREFLSSEASLTSQDLIFGTHKMVTWCCSQCSSLFSCSVSDRVSSKARDCINCERKFAIVGKLTFNGVLVGLRFLYGCRFADVSLDFLSGVDLKFNLVSVNEIELREVGDTLISELEMFRNIRILNVEREDRYFFKRLNNYLKHHSNCIPVSEVEEYLV